MKKSSLLIICFGVICLVACSIIAQKTTTNSNKLEVDEVERLESPFRYAIIAGETDIEKYVNRFPNDFLTFEVLLDDKAFNEQNLEILSKLLSKRFNKALTLNVYIYTTLDAIKTPEENDRSNLKGQIDKYFNYKRALFVRNSYGNEWIEYSIPNTVDNKKIIIKGCYIKCS